LAGIERDPMTPPQVRRIIRIARFGARVPKVPQYAEAFQAIGPAAIKLGQALATRPDLVGDAVSITQTSFSQCSNARVQRFVYRLRLPVPTWFTGF
jgi:hypothetical protein